MLLVVQLALAGSYALDYKLVKEISGEVYIYVAMWLLMVISLAKILAFPSAAGWGLAIGLVSLGAICSQFRSTKDYSVFLQLVGAVIALGVALLTQPAALTLI